jgi:catechol-2,3-dioxygenase
MEIIRLELQTHLLSEMKSFYVDQLSLPLREETDTTFAVRAGNTTLKFSAVSDGTHPFYHFAFNIPENKIGEAREWLLRRTELLQDDGDDVIHFVHWNAHSVYFQDPSGNIVELIARHNLNNRSDCPFDQHDLLCISEIGLPLDDVLSTVENLQLTAGIHPWREPSHSFAPLGDEHGLFILVSKGRIWYMSDKPAQAFPLSVTIAGEEEKQLQLQQYTLRFVNQRSR